MNICPETTTQGNIYGKKIMKIVVLMKKSIDINLLVYCNSILYTSHWPGSSFSKPLQTTARITLTLLFTCQWPHYIKVYLNEAVLITFNVFIHGWRTFNRTSLYLIPKHKYLLHMHAWQILLHASVAMKNQLYMRYNKNEWIYWSSLSKRSPISKSLNKMKKTLWVNDDITVDGDK